MRVSERSISPSDFPTTDFTASKKQTNYEKDIINNDYYKTQFFILDKYKFCYCSNYNGIVCQIDPESHGYLAEVYTVLLDLVKNRGSEKYERMLFNEKLNKSI